MRDDSSEGYSDADRWWTWIFHVRKYSVLWPTNSVIPVLCPVLHNLTSKRPRCLQFTYYAMYRVQWHFLTSRGCILILAVSVYLSEFFSTLLISIQSFLFKYEWIYLFSVEKSEYLFRQKKLTPILAAFTLTGIHFCYFSVEKLVWYWVVCALIRYVQGCHLCKDSIVCIQSMFSLIGP